jgi:predicted esterase
VRGYQAKVAVTGPTRLDWPFVTSNHSFDTLPDDWTPGYQSTAQHYELFVPEDYDPQETYPLVLFISSSSSPAGWAEWQACCRRKGILFASPYDAGNECPMKTRARIVLDVLDKLRRTYRLDTDRIYLGGISGGARTACHIAFALPEYFGGVIPICASGELRSERWLWHRVIERLSVAYVTGETDFNRAEVERLRQPVMEALGVRSKVWVVDGMGHAIPNDHTLQVAFEWLEEGLPRRRQAAEQWPAIRIPAHTVPTGSQWADLLLAEAQERLKQRPTMFSGLVQLKGLAARWPETAAAAKAKSLLTEYTARKEHPWAKADLDEQRRFRLADATATTAYATGPLLPPYDKRRAEYVQAALDRWQEILRRNPNESLQARAQEQVESLKRLLPAEPVGK